VLLLALIAGFAIGFTPVFAIIHELGHVLAGWFSPEVEVAAVRWTATYWRGSPTAMLFASGHYFMMLVDVGAAIHAGRKGALGVGFFALGHALCQPVFAAFSHDFADLSQAFGFDAALFWWIFLAGSTAALVFLTASKLIERREHLIRRLRASARQKPAPRPEPAARVGGREARPTRSRESPARRRVSAAPPQPLSTRLHP
jgi:hypothetical protein